MDEPKIEDITDPSAFLPEPSTPWWLWTLAGLAALLLISLAIYFLSKPSASRQRATLLDDARARLAKLKDEAPSLAPNVTATRISLIIRRYLEAAFRDPALFETNEEFSLRPRALEKLHPDSRQPVTDYLTKLSQLKYAPSNSPESEALIDQAEALIANIEINVEPADA